MPEKKKKKNINKIDVDEVLVAWFWVATLPGAIISIYFKGRLCNHLPNLFWTALSPSELIQHRKCVIEIAVFILQLFSIWKINDIYRFISKVKKKKIFRYYCICIATLLLTLLYLANKLLWV